MGKKCGKPIDRDYFDYGVCVIVNKSTWFDWTVHWNVWEMVALDLVHSELWFRFEVNQLLLKKIHFHPL